MGRGRGDDPAEAARVDASGPAADGKSRHPDHGPVHAGRRGTVPPACPSARGGIESIHSPLLPDGRQCAGKSVGVKADSRQRKMTMSARLSDSVRRQHEGCSLWPGHRNAQGYGVVNHHGRCMLAHRLAWELRNGPIPRRLCVLHRCDVPPCVNPDHLFLGTKRDNTQDAIEKGRHKIPRISGEKNGAAKLSVADVRWIRAKAKLGVMQDELACQFGVAQSTISLIVSGRTWITVA